MKYDINKNPYDALKLLIIAHLKSWKITTQNN